MQTSKVKISDVIYNAATSSFEALVTVYGEHMPRKYACSIDAPIALPFEEAAAGLKRQALRRHKAETGMFSVISPNRPAPRAGRAPRTLSTWIKSLPTLRDDRAA